MLLYFFCILGILPWSFTTNTGKTYFAKTLSQTTNVSSIDTIQQFITINKILIVGNNVTMNQIILRELSYRSGDIIYKNDLESILDLDKKKLINTKLFNTVEISALESGLNTIDLVISVNERWYIFPSFRFDLADRNFNEWWKNYNHDLSRVNYGFKLSHKNMRGRNETLGILARFGFQREFELSYRFPYIDKNQKQGLYFSLNFSEAKNLSYKTVDHKFEFLHSPNVLKTSYGGNLVYTFRNSFYQTHSVGVEYRNDAVSDSVLISNPNYFGNEKRRQQCTVFSYNFVSDHRDYIGYALNGHLLTIGINKFGINSSSDLNKIEMNISFAKYLPLKHNFYLSNYISGHLSTQNNIPYANYAALGYRDQVVRGYEIYVVEGPYFAVNKTTFKKRIFSGNYRLSWLPFDQFRYLPFSIYLKTYADIGYVKNYSNYTNNNRLTDKYIYSVGGGIDFVGSYDTVLRIEYTFNAEGDRGFAVNFRKEF